MNPDASISALVQNLDEEAEIAALAYRYYIAEGRPNGMAQEHWARAERYIRQQRKGETEEPSTFN